MSLLVAVSILAAVLPGIAKGMVEDGRKGGSEDGGVMPILGTSVGIVAVSVSSPMSSERSVVAAVTSSPVSAASARDDVSAVVAAGPMVKGGVVDESGVIVDGENGVEVEFGVEVIVAAAMLELVEVVLMDATSVPAISWQARALAWYNRLQRKCRFIAECVPLNVHHSWGQCNTVHSK